MELYLNNEKRNQPVSPSTIADDIKIWATYLNAVNRISMVT